MSKFSRNRLIEDNVVSMQRQCLYKYLILTREALMKTRVLTTLSRCCITTTCQPGYLSVYLLACLSVCLSVCLSEAAFRSYWRRRFSVIIQKCNSRVVLRKLSRLSLNCLDGQDKLEMDKAIHSSIH